jgi:hypothetical protein
MCDWLRGGGTSSLGLGCKGPAGFVGSFGLVTGACLGPTVNLGSDFAVLPFLLVFVTSLRVGVSVTGPGLCWGSVGEAAVTTKPPRTMWFQPVLGSPAWRIALLGLALARHEDLVCSPLAAFNRRPPRKIFFPLNTALVVGCVVSSTAITLKLLL